MSDPEIPIHLIAAGALGLALTVVFLARRPVWGVYGAIFACAILLSPKLPVVREKVSACELIMACTWAALLFRPRRRAPNAARLTSSQKAALRFAAILVIMMVSSFFVNLLQGSIVIFSFSVVEIANYCYGFLLLCTIVALVDHWDAWFTCMRVWCLGTAIVSVVAIWAMSGGAPEWTKDEFTGRVSSTLRESGQVASYCIPIFSFALMMAARRHGSTWVRVYYFLVAVGAVISALVSGSRIAFFLTFFVSAATLIILSRRTDKNPHFHPATFRLCGLAVLIGLLYFSVSVWTNASLRYRAGETAPHHRPIVMLREWYQGERVFDKERDTQLRVALKEFPKRPLFGAGPANFSPMYRVHEPHNTYLGTLVNGGALAFIALTLMLWCVFKCGLSAARRTSSSTRRLAVECALLGLTSILLYGMTCYGLRQRPMWIACGLVIALPRCIGRERFPYALLHHPSRRRERRPSEFEDGFDSTFSEDHDVDAPGQRVRAPRPAE